MADLREFGSRVVHLARRAWHASRPFALAVTRTLAPARCVACRGRLAEVEEGVQSSVWCDGCAASVVPLGIHFCLLCRTPLRVGPCSCPDRLALLAAVQYGEAVAALVRDTKYEGWEPLLEMWLAVWCAVVGEAEFRYRGGPQLICAVPTHPVRRRERGMALPDRWAARLAAHCGRPRVAALVRARATRPQVGLDRRRRLLNVTGAFRPGPDAAAVRGRSVALVDDVVTSGATVRESANLLRSLGARQVEVWSFAYEPIE